MFHLYRIGIARMAIAICVLGGQRGIRTPDTLLTYTRFPGVRLQPLGHLS